MHRSCSLQLPTVSACSWQLSQLHHLTFLLHSSWHLIPLLVLFHTESLALLATFTSVHQISLPTTSPFLRSTTSPQLHLRSDHTSPSPHFRHALRLQSIPATSESMLTLSHVHTNVTIPHLASNLRYPIVSWHFESTPPRPRFGPQTNHRQISPSATFSHPTRFRHFRSRTFPHWNQVRTLSLQVSRMSLAFMSEFEIVFYANTLVSCSLNFNT